MERKAVWITFSQVATYGPISHGPVGYGEEREFPKKGSQTLRDNVNRLLTADINYPSVY